MDVFATDGDAPKRSEKLESVIASEETANVFDSRFVTVYTGDSGEKFRIDTSKIRNETVEPLLAAHGNPAQLRTGAPPAQASQRVAEAQRRTFRKLAEEAADAGNPAQPFIPATVTPAPDAEPVRPANVRTTSPVNVSSREGSSRTESGSLFTHLGAGRPDVADAQPSRPAGGPPTIAVEFEEKGSAFKTRAFYHQVIRSGMTLALVFDNRAEGYPVVFPGDTGRPLAVLLKDRNCLYEVATTGIQFRLDSYDICILLITDERVLT